MDESGPNIGDLIGMLRRRWFVIALPVVLATGVASGIASVLPSTYTARARILVANQVIPEELARSTVTRGPTERISLIEQRLLSRETMLEIAQTFSLFADRGPLPPADVVEIMRRSITMETVVLAMAGRSAASLAVDISFSDEDPKLATQVANDLLNRVLEQNLAQRATQTANTLSFFQSEADRLGGELVRLEEEIAAFKAANKDALPDTLQFRLEAAAELEERMFGRESRAAGIDDEIRNLNASPADAAFTTSGGRSADPNLVEILRLRLQLEEQRAVYAETHPTVRTLASRLVRLEAAHAALLGGADEADEAATAQESALSAAQAEVARRISTLERERELLAAQRVVDEERLAALRTSIQRTPDIEIELGRLIRERDAVADQHREALLKRAEAEIGERLEVNQQAERFEVIEQPVQPTRPSSPNRPLIVAAGAAGGLALGGGVALLLELLFPFIRTSRDIERQFGARPFVTVPYFETASRRFWRRARIAAVAMAVLALAPATLWVIDQHYMPLSLLAERAAQLTGVGRLLDLARARFAS